jgi:formylglycine-generating enzyme required for sulfatase activity
MRKVFWFLRVLILGMMVSGVACRRAPLSESAVGPEAVVRGGELPVGQDLESKLKSFEESSNRLKTRAENLLKPLAQVSSTNIGKTLPEIDADSARIVAEVDALLEGRSVELGKEIDDKSASLGSGGLSPQRQQKLQEDFNHFRNRRTESLQILHAAKRRLEEGRAKTLAVRSIFAAVLEIGGPEDAGEILKKIIAPSSETVQKPANEEVEDKGRPMTRNAKEAVVKGEVVPVRDGKKALVPSREVEGARESGSVSQRHGGMVLVRGGTLPKGSGSAGQVVEDFSIGRTEVTWGEWKVVREWAATKGYDLAAVGGTHPDGGSDQLPVVEVSWHDVVKWCNARSEREGKTAVYLVRGVVYRTGGEVPTVDANANGYRLPLEKEWEWAARGGVQSQGYTYSGSNTIDEVAWYGTNSGGETKVVGTKAANELGIYDMSGNVWEWCWDASDANRRNRGGSWLYSAGYCTVVFQSSSTPTRSITGIGFRVVLSSVP